MKMYRAAGIAVAVAMVATGTLAQSQTTPPAVPEPKAAVEGTMTTKRMGAIIGRLDAKAVKSTNADAWQFQVEEVPVVVVTDAGNNRMRIMIALKKADKISPAELLRLSQANFDTALDAPAMPSPRGCCGRPSFTRSANCTRNSSSPASARR